MEFNEKPAQPQSNLASMGIYIFSWSKLKRYLKLDEVNSISKHDFGKNIIPQMLDKGEKIYAYPFREYWRDVGTIESLYEAHMDLLPGSSVFEIQDINWPIYSTLAKFPFLISGIYREGNSLISDNSFIHGQVENSIIFPGVYIGSNAKVKDSIIMPGAYVGHSACIEKAIIGPDAVIANDCAVIGDAKGSIAVVGQNTVASCKKIKPARYTANQVWSMNRTTQQT